MISSLHSFLNVSGPIELRLLTRLRRQWCFTKEGILGQPCNVNLQ